jgi:hypothetical protein
MKKRALILIIILFIFIISTISYCHYNFKTERDVVIKEKSTIITPPLDNDSSISRKKNAIETEYPDLKNFESQKSFAGQSIKVEIDGIDHYFAYIVHGSGLPIVHATCFRVDRMDRVFKVGEFPDFLDSYQGYRDVSPKTCAGIK